MTFSVTYEAKLPHHDCDEMELGIEHSQISGDTTVIIQTGNDHVKLTLSEVDAVADAVAAYRRAVDAVRNAVPSPETKP